MVWAAGDADGEVGAGDAPRDVFGEGGVGGAGGGDHVDAAGDGFGGWCLLRCFGGEGVVDVGPRRVPLPLPVEVPWFVDLFTGFGGVACIWCRTLPLVTLLVGVAPAMVLFVPFAWMV